MSLNKIYFIKRFDVPSKKKGKVLYFSVQLKATQQADGMISTITWVEVQLSTGRLFSEAFYIDIHVWCIQST